MNEEKKNIGEDEKNIERISEDTQVETKEIKSEEPENVEKHKERKNKRRVGWIIGFTLLICILIFLSVIFALMNINNNKILSRIYINNVDVSGLTQEEAVVKIKDITSNKLTEDMKLKYEDYETTINANQINAKFDIENAVSKAYNIGRDGNIVVNNYKILMTNLLTTKIDLGLYYDDEKLENKLKDISSKIPGSVKQSSYYIEDKNLIIVKGKSGVQIKKEELKQTVINSIKQISNKYEIVPIPADKVNPDAIDVERIREEIYKEPKDAYVSKNPTTVHTHIDGVDFKISMEDAKKLLQEDKKEYTIPLKITKPSKTIEDLGKEAFPNQLATYTTRYDVTNSNRSNNLTLAAKKINGTVIMPGETFSYNQVVGERTIAAGYKEAGAYAGGKVIQSVGGGICQVSSTLYNAVLLANLEITDRSNHAFLTGYVAASRDATVNWGTLDFKFKNTRKYPIKIEASAKNGICKISVHGIKEETEYEIVIQSKVLSYISYNVKYIEDDTLEEGKEIVEQSGQNGCTSEAYRILKLNGQIISKTLLSKDTYDPMQRIVRKGTKKVEQTVQTQTPIETEPEEENPKI